jgi:hypothetical protein
MANPLSPHGFSVLAANGAFDYSSQCHMYEIPLSDATNTYAIGDAVKTITGGGSDTSNPWGTFGIPQVVKCTGATTELARGIIVSVFRNPYALDYTYVPQVKLQNYYVMVADDPNLVMEIMGDNTAAGVTAGWIGGNATYNATAAQTIPTGLTSVLSTMTLTTGTIAGTVGFPLKVLGVSQRVNVSNSANTPFIVTWNAHELKSSGTIGQ